MRPKPVYRVPFCFIAAIVACWSITSHAFVVSIDEFSIVRNGAAFFTDSFADGIEPPSGPNGATTYNVLGTIPSGAESGGKLVLDTANGVVSFNALDQARIEVRTLLLTNIDPSNLTAGLKSDDTLSLTGIFSATTPSGVSNPQYSIRFVDSPGGGVGSNQILQLQVTYRTATNQALVRYILQDFVANTIDVLGSAVFNPGTADQILLNISRPDALSDDFFGSFAYITGGVVGAFTPLGVGQMFDGENFVRAAFNIADGFVVPEPGTAWLLGLAAFALLAGRRRAR